MVCCHGCRQEIAAYAAAVATLDLRSPHTWYPYARAIKRKIIYHGGELQCHWQHMWTQQQQQQQLPAAVLSRRCMCQQQAHTPTVATVAVNTKQSHQEHHTRHPLISHSLPPGQPSGPTNSGKTYNALQSLAAAERGIYCAPLRLLAMEVYETLNHRGVYCDLVSLPAASFLAIHLQPRCCEPPCSLIAGAGATIAGFVWCFQRMRPGASCLVEVDVRQHAQRLVASAKEPRVQH